MGQQVSPAVLPKKLTFPSPRRTMKKITTAMRNASCLIPFFHAQKLAGIIDKGAENTSLENN